MDNIDNKISFNPHKQFLLSDLMENIMKLGNIKLNEEIIFITNICRIIDFQDRSHYYSINQTAKKTNQPPEHISRFAEILRGTSRN